MTNLPANVYRVKQRDFTAIPREPWVYWIPDDLRKLFETLPALGDVAQPRQGLATANNFRFLRGWWEVGVERIAFGCRDADEAQATGKRWLPYVKGGKTRRWYGNLEHTINWGEGGKEIGSSPKAVIRNSEFYLQEGLTFNRFSSGRFAIRWLMPGYIFDCNGPSILGDSIGVILAVANTTLFSGLCALMNPTINFQVGDVKKIPVPLGVNERVFNLARACIRSSKTQQSYRESTYDFVNPPRWPSGLNDLVAAQTRLDDLESQIEDEVYRLYGISDADRAAIEAELAGDPIPEDEEEIAAYLDDDGDEKIEPPMSREELAVRWISYAVGVVLGRFTIGDPSIDDLRLTIDEASTDESKIVNRQSKIGNGIYRREDFAVGSLPAPDEAEFDELVGPPERFAYIDEAGGRHIFPAEVEASLQDLTVDDGIAVLDAGHPRDLPTLVEQALRLMLDFRLTTGETDDLRLDREGKDDLVNRKSKIVNPPSGEVIRIGAGGDLRRFLSRDFFTDWHIKWYSIPYQAKAPVYWPLQSANRRYGFVLFHEKINKTTLYTLQRDYLDYKINGLKQRIGDLTAALETRQGSQRKRVARQVATLRETLAEVEAFAKTMARIVREGYEPEPNWIDDRVILRMAPLWELIPLWEQYPQKHWERLQAGEYDWSHIARHYWPARVRAACRENKSYAIAHGHEEWYEGE